MIIIELYIPASNIIVNECIIRFIDRSIEIATISRDPVSTSYKM